MSELRTGTEDYVMGCCYGDEVKLEDGRSVEVTTENVDLYVDNRVREYLVPSQFSAFKQGFNRVFNPAAFDMFRPIELEALVIGEKYFDWKALEQLTQYKRPYKHSHPTIKMFWKVFHALDDDMKRKFLVFVAGSDRVPVGGLGNLGLRVVPLQVPMDDSVNEQPCDNEDRLTLLMPEGHGCDNHGFRRTLRLPMYTSLELMEDRLTVALSYYDCPFHIA
ncbi:probable E3 ubiquitin-protein ligase HERC3 [Strongylocentrotus purpuratus]|uniref:HECT-type E3 ubiquitin transferase n=1 Tax=Strongylocentrotus purpuratus TaxID=7668 RepID=A0A7M7NLX8_STRPU|nr:probable E3 ubiquitin-protein ligase HERC3 [Strongylocentrotus purpuratus]